MDLNSTMKFEMVLPADLWTQLRRHLFPGDGDEHGAVILAGLAPGNGRVRLLARELHLARDGVDYLPGQRGYRMLTPSFITEKVLLARDEKLAYLAIHNHAGSDYVAFSEDDLRSHERGYPALRDITRGQIVGGLVFAANAAAGDLWLPSGRATLAQTLIVGSTYQTLYPEKQRQIAKAGPAFDRQVLLFGDRGQEILKGQKVGIIGLGGVGSIVCELLARLGVGTLVLVDPDRIEITNVPRTLGSRYRDALGFLASERRPKWLQEVARRLSRRKVAIAARAARKANPDVHCVPLALSAIDPEAAEVLATCDYLFLAADSMQARLLFNALVQQYFIPGVELGAKVQAESKTGEVGDVFSVVRPVFPGAGCLWCNNLISPAGLQEEALGEKERKRQRYVDHPDVHAPSVVSLNAVAASLGVNDYLFRVTGLRLEEPFDDSFYIHARRREARSERPRKSHDCSECSGATWSRLGRGQSWQLPVRERRENE